MQRRGILRVLRRAAHGPLLAFGSPSAPAAGAIARNETAWSSRGGGVHTPTARAAGAAPATHGLSSVAALDAANHHADLPLASFDFADEPARKQAMREQLYGASESAAESGESAVLRVIREQVVSGQENAFAVYDLAAVQQQFLRWHAVLPRVMPFYAVKCNPDERIVALLAGLGAGFDCASKAEIELVQSFGVGPEQVVFANPCKQPSHVAHAAASGVDLTVFDGHDELDKMAALQPSARLLLRILVDDSQAVCTMSQKYGAPLSQVAELLAHADSLGLNVVGISFHVGSGSRSAQPFADAVHSARRAFDIAESMGKRFELLDIGGGFPGEAMHKARAGTPTFEEIGELVRPALDSLFPVESGVRLIAEPGRFFAHSAATLCTNVIGRKVHMTGPLRGQPMYFVNDGLYGSFNCVLYDHATVQPYALRTAAAGVPAEPCSVWGPTCDGLDCITQEARLPPLNIGDWIRWPNMGAYTSAAGSTFNGMERSSKIYI